MILYVITEYCYDFEQTTVIGVCDSIKQTEKMIKSYYETFKEVTREDVQDSGLEYKLKLRVSHKKTSSYVVDVFVNSYMLNQL